MNTRQLASCLLIAFANAQALADPVRPEIPQDPIAIAKAIAQLIADDCKAKSKSDVDKFTACFNAGMTEAINRMQPRSPSRSQV